jgi:hypothetical protein
VIHRILIGVCSFFAVLGAFALGTVGVRLTRGIDWRELGSFNPREWWDWWQDQACFIADWVTPKGTLYDTYREVALLIFLTPLAIILAAFIAIIGK